MPFKLYLDFGEESEEFGYNISAYSETTSLKYSSKPRIINNFKIIVSKWDEPVWYSKYVSQHQNYVHYFLHYEVENYNEILGNFPSFSSLIIKLLILNFRRIQ